MSDEDVIRSLLEKRVEALRHRDAASANAALDPHMVAFELAGPLQVSPTEATDDNLTQNWLDSFEDGPHVAMDELSIHADGAVAFCHALNHLQGRRSDGQQVDIRMRTTLGFRKVNGEWKVVHAHTSLPR